MMRLAWISLFAFANVLGPSVCCCAMAQWLAAKPVKVVKAEPVCPHCAKCEQESPEPESPSPIQPCPCGSAPTVEMMAADAKNAWIATAELPATAATSETLSIGCEARLTATSARSACGSFMTKDIKLYAHHVLRC